MDSADMPFHMGVVYFSTIKPLGHTYIAEISEIGTSSGIFEKNIDLLRSMCKWEEEVPVHVLSFAGKLGKHLC